MGSPDPQPVAAHMSAPTAKWHFAILTYGNLAETRRCLASLRASVDEPFVVHIVDNASVDGTQEWLRSQREPWLRVRFNPTNRGVPGGRNDLLAFALPTMRSDDWLVFCDNDLEFTKGWLAKFRDAMQQFPNARMLGQAGHLVHVGNEGRALLPSPVAASPVDVVSGGFACMVRADIAAAIGPFDENLGLFWHEDDDWSVRALQLGVEVVAVPDAGIVHHEHASGVANDGLREGGSRKNQRYLADKWRRNGWIDDGGWVRQQSAHYKPPEVRAELQRRCNRASPIGRIELHDACALLDRLVGAADPVAEFGARPEPLPACFAAWVAWNRETAAACGATELQMQLDRIAAVTKQHSIAARLLERVRVPAPNDDAPAGQGLCAASDFDDPLWLAAADELEPGHAMRDPHARDLTFWEDASALCAAMRSGVRTNGEVALVVGEARPRLLRVLAARFAEVVAFDPASPPAEGSCAAAFVIRAHAPSVMSIALRACRSDALVVAIGDVVLDGAPMTWAPQPMQLAHELGPRNALRPLWPIRTAVDACVLDACSVVGTERSGPKLAVLGRRLTTAFVVAFAREAKSQTLPSAQCGSVLTPQRSRASLTVGVDLRTVAYADSTARGIGHYTVHHLAAVARRAADAKFVCYLPNGVGLPVALRMPNVERRDVDDFVASDVDLVHVPDPMNLSLGFDSPLRAFRHPRTTVLFHDLTPLRHYIAQWPAANRDAYLDRLRQIERSGAVLLCNSSFTAQDAVATLGIDAVRAEPVLAGWNGMRSKPDTASIAAVQQRLGVRGPFVLHVGALDPHKNFAASLSAFLQARGRRPLQMVVVGAVDPGIEQFAALCADKRIPDVVFTGYLPREDLDALYASATALLFLSKSEGFGFPLLEAMAAGCPVIGTAVTSHPEVVGDAGILVPLDGAAEHAGRALLRLIDDPQVVRTMRERGPLQAQKFTWDDVADRTLATWRRMAAKPSSGAAHASQFGQHVLDGANR